MCRFQLIEPAGMRDAIADDEAKPIEEPLLCGPVPLHRLDIVLPCVGIVFASPRRAAPHRRMQHVLAVELLRECIDPLVDRPKLAPILADPRAQRGGVDARQFDAEAPVGAAAPTRRAPP